MKQGDIYLVDFNPVKGQEQAGIRPALIVSGNALNDNMKICIVCPMISKIKNYAGCVVINPNATNGLSESSEVIGFQIRAITKDRMIRRLGGISRTELQEIITGINGVLKY